MEVATQILNVVAIIGGIAVAVLFIIVFVKLLMMMSAKVDANKEKVEDSENDENSINSVDSEDNENSENSENNVE